MDTGIRRCDSDSISTDRHTDEHRYPGKDRKGKPHIIPACSPDEMQCNPGRLRVKDTQAKTDRRRRN